MARIWYSFEHPQHGEITVQLDCTVGSPEPDVGIFGAYLDGWDFAFLPVACPLTEIEIARILEAEEHTAAIEEQAIEKAYDDSYDYEDYE